MRREARLFERRGDAVVCLACERRCEIKSGAVGFCRTRMNLNGTLYTLIYGEISSVSANPIEKKPLFHFWPGSKALTVGSWSCNFTCPWCQNHDISKSANRIGWGRFISPQELVELALKLGCQGTSISFNEPTLLLEYSLDVFRLARERGLYNTFVTNGYMTREALELLIEAGLDGMNIDIKGDGEAVLRYCKADVEKVWRNARIAKERGVWVEITTLVIPGVNDREGVLRSIAGRIREELGPDTPWHVTRYYPAYEFLWKSYVPPTEIETLERAWEIGRSEGLQFVYLGNVPGHPRESTYCPRCGELLIERWGFEVRRRGLGEDNTCSSCGAPIPLVGRFCVT